MSWFDITCYMITSQSKTLLAMLQRLFQAIVSLRPQTVASIRNLSNTNQRK